MNDKRLIVEAKKIRKRSYSPYSKFKVGAALLGKSGKVYHGINVENSSFGVGICAERSALIKAISSGEEDFISIAIIASGEDVVTPCGLCRQALFEFSPEMKVICTNLKGRIRKFTLKHLLPYPFKYRKKRKR